MRDSSVYVRKIATLALGKVYRLINEQREDFIELLSTALSDNSPCIYGAAVMTLEIYFPEEL